MEIAVKILVNPYFKAILSFIILFIAGKLVYLFITRVAIKWAKKTSTEIDNIILSKINTPIFYLIILYGASVAINFLPLPDSPKTILSRLIISIALIICCYLVAFFINLLIKTWLAKSKEVIAKGRQNDFIAVSRKILNFIIFILLIIFILALWGVKVTALVASLGIVGIVIGLALQTTLANIFGGIALIADRSFKIGDFVELDTGEPGEIIDVGLRSTRIKSFEEGNEIIIPNSILMNSRIINYGRPEVYLKKRIKIGVAYGSDIRKVKNILLNCTSKIKNILKNPSPQVYFTEMADFSLNFEVVFWISNYQQRLRVQDEFVSLAYEELQTQGIQIPFPTHTIYIKRDE